MNRVHGFARVTACSPEVVVGNPEANLQATIAMLEEHSDSDVVAFPELGITGYTCGDLFKQQSLLRAAEKALIDLAQWSHDKKQLIFVGAPIPVGTELFNCAVIINNGTIIGAKPKENLAEGTEFYEGRHFAAADGDEPHSIPIGDHSVPFGIHLLFTTQPPFEGKVKNDALIVAVEICQDVWMPIPPSSFAAIHGANLCVNLSASSEQIEKFQYREDLIRVHSGKNYMAYLYSASGPSESTSDLVFAGDCMIAENWRILERSPHIGDGTLNFGPRSVTADIDYQMLSQEKRNDRSFGNQLRGFNVQFDRIYWQSHDRLHGFKRYVNGLPFIPRETERRKQVCQAVFDIQCAGFYRRWKHIGFPVISVGISGGSDSTHLLNVLTEVCKAAGQPLTKIKARSLPGFGTSAQTRNIGETLCRERGIPFEVVDIRPIALGMLRSIGHCPFGIYIDHLDDNYTADEAVRIFQELLLALPPDMRHDLVFENIQTRVRTNILMALGFMVGTGDLSESAEGWMTFAGDHVSNYNPNAGVPKTLIKWLIEYVAKERTEAGPLRDAMLECAGLPFSPELLPLGAAGEIVQSTESEIGSYDLIDFFLLYFVRYGFTPQKILFLAEHADFPIPYPVEERERVLEIFIKRFFSNQWKRNCVPDGPKVGSVSLSPRGDWRMPADADPTAWLLFQSSITAPTRAAVSAAHFSMKRDHKEGD